MADLTVNITETITLNSQTQAETYTQTISGINYIDTRNLSCPSGSTTELFKFSNNPGAGQFVTSPVRYNPLTRLRECSFLIDSSEIAENWSRKPPRFGIPSECTEYTPRRDRHIFLAGNSKTLQLTDDAE